ncbi:Lrp/AsnC family transcriptional regulator [Mucilaginibacter auburnensis]|uniref:DNA-binding Lrp family transcriptional regulator n=1 Tax=Mucilaginibacter auburnensis TaxID=1457233 RepID=A0A2H9VV19_9SPHI|nr:Lrp/AsnC family transcriptional regulator [Mucilaginibacter auburnensis]PJJ84657.1 DNA-binding Lrp family transcriptional regulator [Mucilaginibacter auburnensis]
MFKPDKTDYDIMRILQSNSDVTTKELAFDLRKSLATVHERVKRLKKEGYIRKTVALLDRKKINKNLIAFSHVLLNGHAFETLAAFEKEVSKFPEVMECYQMTGTFDFILRVATEDMESYHEFYRHKLSTLPNIATVQSFFVMSEIKSETAYPI